MKIWQNFSLQCIKYLSPKISPPRVISDADKPQNSVPRLISPVKMPHRWQFFNRWPHQWRFCHRWCHRCNLCLYWKYSDTVTVGLSDSFANPRGCHGNRRLLYLTTIEWDNILKSHSQPFMGDWLNSALPNHFHIADNTIKFLCDSGATKWLLRSQVSFSSGQQEVEGPDWSRSPTRRKSERVNTKFAKCKKEHLG